MKTKTPRTKLLASLMHVINHALHSPTGQPEHNEQRRAFLNNAGKVAAATAILPLMESCSKAIETIAPTISGAANTNVITPRVAIVGAGIAGLHAAYLLKQKGIAATVFEASKRTGGRMFTRQDLVGKGLYTEMGGEFIDSIHKDMLNLAKTFNLELLDTRASKQSTLQYQAFYANGVHYTEQQVIDAFMPFVQQIKNDQLGMSGVITADDHSSYDAVLDNMSIAEYFDRIGMQGWIREILDVAYVTEFGLPITEQTALNFLWMISPKVTNGHFEVFGASDERYKIKGGNQQITDKLAAVVKGQIYLEHELISIKQTEGNTYDMIFNTPNGAKTISCDYVLITIPFTKLRSVEVSPAWPEWKRKAIYDIGYGYNSKLMMGFNKKYWYDLGYAGYFFADNKLQSGWENSALQTPIQGGMTIYSGGQPAIDLANGSVAYQVNQHMDQLDQMYPGAKQNFNGKAERFTWPTYKWSLCSYACFRPGQYTTIAGNEIKPVGNIFFAGEHCSYDFQGYMNGGAETGRKAAEAIFTALKTNAK